MHDVPLGGTKSPQQVCIAITRKGMPCKAWAMPGKVVCRYHSPAPEDIARRLDEARRGGEARKGRDPVEVGALADDETLATTNVATASGVRDYLAAALRALARLPFSVRIAHAIAQLASAQRQAIETADVERRLVALETATPATTQNCSSSFKHATPIN